MRRDRRSEGCRALRRRGRVALRSVIHGNRRLCAYCGSYARADVLSHDGRAVGGADPLTDRATDELHAIDPTDHRGTDDGHADDAGALTSADDGRAIAAAHARSHARTDDGRAFARADHGRADARLG